MSRQIVLPPGAGTEYRWSLDQVVVKAPAALTDGRVTVVEDTLEAGFHLSRHVHRSMVEIFYILDGVVDFVFDDETVAATPGTAVLVPPDVWHAVRCADGARLLTVFSPGGFDRCLAEMAALSPEQADDPEVVARLEERHDIWRR